MDFNYRFISTFISKSYCRTQKVKVKFFRKIEWVHWNWEGQRTHSTHVQVHWTHPTNFQYFTKYNIETIDTNNITRCSQFLHFKFSYHQNIFNFWSIIQPELSTIFSLFEKKIEELFSFFNWMNLAQAVTNTDYISKCNIQLCSNAQNM